MKFKYKAKTREGELQVGFVEAGSRESATNILASHNLFILSVESAENRGFFEAITTYFSRVGRKDMIIFTRQLATFLEARLPLNTALKTLREQTKNAVLKEATFQVAEDVDAGLSFSQALDRQGAVFQPFFIEMVRAAEITGNLNEVAGFLADYAEKEGILVSKTASALVYPAIVVGLFILVAFVMVAFVFPQIGPIFEQSGVNLPIYTRILLSSGNFLSKWWPVLAVMLVFFGVIGLNYARTPEGRSLVDEIEIKMPLLNKVYAPVILARFSNAAALLIHGGIPVAQALEVIGHMVGNVLYRDVMHQISEDVRRGELLSKSIEKYPEYFPSLVSQMISVGETTGKIEQVFARLSGFYNREADAVINNLVDLIQPLLIIGIGVMVAFLFAAILVPLYSLTSHI